MISNPKDIHPNKFYMILEKDDRKGARHHNVDQANTELTRLASISPGKAFYLLEAVAYEEGIMSTTRTEELQTIQPVEPLRFRDPLLDLEVKGFPDDNQH